MAGLLDFLNTDESRLGLGLLAAAGPTATPMSFGQRLQGAMQGIDTRKQGLLKDRYIESQIDENASQNAQRAAAIQKQSEIQKMIGNIFGQQGAAASPTSAGAFVPSVDGMGPTMPPSMNTPQGGSPSRVAGMSIDQVAALHALGGPNLMDAYKWAKDPLQLQQGSTYEDRTTGARTFMPKVGEGIAPDQSGFYNPLPGYAAAQGSIEGAKTAGVEAARSGYEMVKVVGPDGAERYVPKSTMLQTQPAAPAQASTRTNPMTARPGDSDRFGILSQELASAKARGSTADVAAVEREIARLPANARTGDTTSGLSTPGFQATQTTAQKLSAEAGGKINETWLKTSYEPIIAGMGPNEDLLSSVRVARGAIEKMGGTGWGTEAKATAANVLAGLGMSAGNSKMYATSSQVFQNAAMERLQATLNLAKGPQTEGDSVRASQTFAQLKNTTEANAFILDMSEAKAQREKMKAAFYQQSLPIARQKGDLQEVDREWAKRSPSIFTMPSMNKWGVK